MFGAAERILAEPDSKSARDEMLSWLALTSGARLIETARARKTFRRRISTCIEKSGVAIGQALHHPNTSLR